MTHGRRDAWPSGWSRRHPSAGRRPPWSASATAQRDLVTVARGHGRALDDAGRPMSDPQPLSDEPVFDVGSVTKVVVTTALLHERWSIPGRLRLDDPVARWFPEFAGRAPRPPSRCATCSSTTPGCGSGGRRTASARARPHRGAATWSQELPLRYPPEVGPALLRSRLHAARARSSPRELRRARSTRLAQRRRASPRSAWTASGFRPAARRGAGRPRGRDLAGRRLRTTDGRHRLAVPGAGRPSRLRRLAHARAGRRGERRQLLARVRRRRRARRTVHHGCRTCCASGGRCSRRWTAAGRGVPTWSREFLPTGP